MEVSFFEKSFSLSGFLFYFPICLGLCCKIPVALGLEKLRFGYELKIVSN